MSDKPATATYDEALELETAVAKAGLPYGLTHTYAGYSLVREARALCAAGVLGPIRKVAVEYLQGALPHLRVAHHTGPRSIQPWERSQARFAAKSLSSVTTKTPSPPIELKMRSPPPRNSRRRLYLHR